MITLDQIKHSKATTVYAVWPGGMGTHTWYSVATQSMDTLRRDALAKEQKALELGVAETIEYPRWFLTREEAEDYAKQLNLYGEEKQNGTDSN